MSDRRRCVAHDDLIRTSVTTLSVGIPTRLMMTGVMVAVEAPTVMFLTAKMALDQLVALVIAATLGLRSASLSPSFQNGR